MKRIAIVTGAPLWRNPRVVREASALVGAGHRVRVYGPALRTDWFRRDEPIARAGGFDHIVTADLRENASAARRIALRLRTRLAREAVARLHREDPEALGYGLRAALRTVRGDEADLIIGHQETGLWICAQLATEGRRIGIDMEDWYSEDLSEAARRFRPLGLLRALERDALRAAVHRTTTSEALGIALEKATGCAPLEAIYNAPAAAIPERPQRKPGPLRLLWFSQTIGPGRGLELLCAALVAARIEARLTLVGTAGAAYAHSLRTLLAHAGDIALSIEVPVPPQELPALVAAHDIGFALEESTPRNKDLTVSNKILQYLAAGVPTIATDTAGHREVATHSADAVRIVPQGDPRALGEAIRAWSDTATLRTPAEAAIAAAREHFCWDRQAPRLLASIDRGLRA